MIRPHRFLPASFLLLIALGPLSAGVGDPQIRTDHPWYPGELALSTFDRLFATQAEVYQRVTGVRPESDEDKALAAWLWRNTHYWHGEGGHRDLWGAGLGKGGDQRLREYWNGLFGYGFGLCGTTHSQWSAEMEQLLGHGRGRGVGVDGHNSFEVFLKGGPYRDGRWALLDHDLSTIIFNESGERLLSIGEMQAKVDRWIDRSYKPERQRGWLVCGLHPSDGGSYRKYEVAEYLPGYAGPPPILHLRRGERMRRYFEPGLEDGKTFVFWGRNGMAGGIPGPERSRTWVNQPDQMHGSKSGTPHLDGQARFANVEYVYRPEFTSTGYREGVVTETDREVVLSFQTPYIIGATPPSDDTWGIYDDGCRNGLRVRGKLACEVSVSVDAGRNWFAGGNLADGIDLTDQVKGRAQYWLRFSAGAPALRNAELEIRTVCQANVAVLPRLVDERTTISYAASGKALFSMGPEAGLARTFVSAGGLDEKTVTLKSPPLPGGVTAIHAAAHLASGTPPDPEVRYQIDFSLDGGQRWQPIVKDWSIPRQGEEPGDFWSQSFCYGSAELESPANGPILIRFRNDGGKACKRVEAHLVHRTGVADPLKVTYRWRNEAGEQSAEHVFAPSDGKPEDWQLATGKAVRTRSVEFEPRPE